MPDGLVNGSGDARRAYLVYAIVEALRRYGGTDAADSAVCLLQPRDSVGEYLVYVHCHGQ
jgi:hypothetical protein